MRRLVHHLSVLSLPPKCAWKNLIFYFWIILSFSLISYLLYLKDPFFKGILDFFTPLSTSFRYCCTFYWNSPLISVSGPCVFTQCLFGWRTSSRNFCPLLPRNGIVSKTAPVSSSENSLNAHVSVKQLHVPPNVPGWSLFSWGRLLSHGDVSRAVAFWRLQFKV